MIFKGISKRFSLANQNQYNTIGEFWDELELIYGLENLQGLGYNWKEGYIEYAIGLKQGEIKGYNVSVVLPDSGWQTVKGETKNLKEIYNKIYKDGPLTYEIETFTTTGKCEIKYFR